MNDWNIVMLALQGFVIGVVLFQLVKFRKQDDKLYPELDDTPVTRRLFALVGLVAVIGIAQLIQYEINTRECVENTREVLLNATTVAEIRDYSAEVKCQ